MEVRLAVGDHHERATHVRIELAGLRQPAAKQNRSDELVNRDRRDQQQLQLVAPPWKLGGDDGRKPQGNPGLRHQPGPRVLPDRLGKPGQLDACPDAQPDESESDRGQGDRAEPDGGHRVEPKRRADRHEEDHQHRRRATAHGGPQRVALRDRQVLDDHAGGERGQQRLELLRRADLAQHGAHGQQDQRDFAADVAQVERKQDADEDTKGDRPADFPREPRQNLRAAAFAGVEHDARQQHRHGEQHQHHEIGEHDDRQHRVAQPPACSRIRDHRRGHRRREGDDHHDQQGQHDQPLESDGVGRNRQPRPDHPRHHRQTGDGHGQRRGGHADDRRKSGPEAFDAQRQAGDERDQRRGDARDHLKLSGHRFGDQVAKGRPDDHTEEEIPRHAREMEPSQRVTRDRRAHEREPECERGGG